MPRDYFPRVKEAREALKDKALDLFEKYLTIIEEARSKGEFEVAAEHMRWLIEHMPNEDGTRVIDPSASKPKDDGPKQIGPQIQIGIALGPKPEQKSLPAVEVVDITPKKPDGK